MLLECGCDGDGEGELRTACVTVLSCSSLFYLLIYLFLFILIHFILFIVLFFDVGWMLGV